MKNYLLLIYAKEDAWPPDEHAEALAESIGLCHQLHAEGKYLHAAPLEPIGISAHVTVRDGKPIVSDGPFTETKEHLAGYFLVQAADMDEAIQIAAQIPGSRRGTTEIRQLVSLTGMPGETAAEASPVVRPS